MHPAMEQRVQHLEVCQSFKTKLSHKKPQDNVDNILILSKTKQKRLNIISKYKKRKKKKKTASFFRCASHLKQN